MNSFERIDYFGPTRVEFKYALPRRVCTVLLSKVFFLESSEFNEDFDLQLFFDSAA